jgi:UDP-3-O-[3-hydroxymyristoyl] glucosamine N-acyltransferase
VDPTIDKINPLGGVPLFYNLDKTYVQSVEGTMGYNCKSILDELGINYISEGLEGQVKAVSPINEAREGDLTWCYYEKEKGVSMISQSSAGIILCAKSMQGLVHPKDARQQLFFLDNPRYAFVKIMNQMYSKKNTASISARSVISKTAKIGSGCYIGDYTVIGDDCIIGDNTMIGTRVSLQNCHCGNKSIIQSGVTIGEDGFAFERNADGELERFPHIRGVKIGDNVEVGANTNIQRGSLCDTIIGNGTKIADMVHIGHNTQIGKHCQIAAATAIAGSTKVGDMCWTGLNSTLVKVNIGNNVIVGAGAVVNRDVPDGDIVAGVPAKSIKDKVTTNKLFLMAGQTTKESYLELGLKRKRKSLCTIPLRT